MSRMILVLLENLDASTLVDILYIPISVSAARQATATCVNQIRAVSSGTVCVATVQSVAPVVSYFGRRLDT
ncbi:uncharacterized protein ColSpa_11408 [Colletotrichum spaethianum]|uniref:Uncharacterized protein n=1 Tax=Colletotrichum spaethianum TaxID=700344 RepID=A0AA37URQ5_9PEZI|nr:uncharacterized protein ColSpa_11408 [Colletotrichum spaethianum]GKT51227.1 hypothetical protein ColSpa_11408 [Colletotrichum spaethianum]